MIILRLLGSSDDKEKEKIGVARPDGLPLRGFRYPVSGRGSRGSRPSRVSGQRPESSSIQEHRKNRRQGIGASGGSRKNRRHDTLVQKGIEAKSAYRHRLNRRSKKGHRCNGRPLYQRRCQVPRRSFFSTGSTDGASVHTTGVMTSASRRSFFSTGSTDGASEHTIGVMTSAVRRRSFSTG